MTPEARLVTKDVNDANVPKARIKRNVSPEWLARQAARMPPRNDEWRRRVYRRLGYLVD